MLRFHLDEHVSNAIAAGLRQHGIDVTTSTDADLLHAEDEQHVAFAISQERVIITSDFDFLRWHSAGNPHAGIAFARHGKYGVGDLLRILLVMNAVYDPEELTNRVEFL